MHALSSNQGRLAVYAATRGSDGALTVMVVNKTGASIRSPLRLQHFAAGRQANVYRYSSAHLHAIVHGAAVAVDHQRLTTTYPASSITLLVLRHR